MVPSKCLAKECPHLNRFEVGTLPTSWHHGQVAIWKLRSAPLAQSVERLHGKEKVESSILSGSSDNLIRSMDQLMAA